MERKFKIGDKVRIVDVKSNNEGKVRDENKEFTISCYCKNNTYGLYGSVFAWKESELELIKGETTLFDKLAHSIAEAAKEANILVEPTEDEGIKISPLEEKEEDLPIDTPCMAKSDNNDEWRLRYYAGKCKCYICGGKSNNEDTTSSWDCIIPCDMFNFENPEESLKYNIVK